MRADWEEKNALHSQILPKPAKKKTNVTVQPLKGRPDPIPSPSSYVTIQIVDGKVCLSCKGKTLLGIVNKFLKTKKLSTSPSNVLMKIFPEKWFKKYGLRNMVQEKWLTRKKGGFIP